MIYLRLTPRQRHIKRWQERRNHLVCKLLDENPRMTRPDALALANKLMRQRQGKVVA